MESISPCTDSSRLPTSDSDMAEVKASLEKLEGGKLSTLLSYSSKFKFQCDMPKVTIFLDVPCHAMTAVV